jgi:hypothetical protein
VDPAHPKTPFRRYQAPQRDLRSWKKTFPDPSTSPARYTKTLSVGCPQVVRAVDAEVGGWITGFSRVVHLDLGLSRLTGFDQPAVPLVPFHGFSPVIKSLRVVLRPSPLAIINLILSFPLLEDLAVSIDRDGIGQTTAMVPKGTRSCQPAAQPLDPTHVYWVPRASSEGGMEPFTRRLLSLPGGIHFRKLTLTYHSRGRSFVDNGVGGGVFSYPRIPRYYFGPVWYVQSAFASVP